MIDVERLRSEIRVRKEVASRLIDRLAVVTQEAMNCATTREWDSGNFEARLANLERQVMEAEIDTNAFIEQLRALLDRPVVH